MTDKKPRLPAPFATQIPSTDETSPAEVAGPVGETGTIPESIEHLLQRAAATPTRHLDLPTTSYGPGYTEEFLEAIFVHLDQCKELADEPVQTDPAGQAPICHRSLLARTEVYGADSFLERVDTQPGVPVPISPSLLLEDDSHIDWNTLTVRPPPPFRRFLQSLQQLQHSNIAAVLLLLALLNLLVGGLLFCFWFHN